MLFVFMPTNLPAGRRIGTAEVNSSGKSPDADSMATKPVRTKRPRDTNQLAKRIVDLATGNATEKQSLKADAGRKAGLKGGAARAPALSPEQRKEVAKKAAAKRWGKG
ncbi:hypothetical protein [Caulifigura coniformis]|uniref:hypothetical protein n=1 Tax=Caulifigura coniformis TaxID=2527983 RepID=UPI0018D22EDD|nr:hypothetical protein [Caulifigura coniformis]